MCALSSFKNQEPGAHAQALRPRSVSPTATSAVPMKLLGGEHTLDMRQWEQVGGWLGAPLPHGAQPCLLSTSPVYPCNEYGSVTLVDLKMNLKLLHADVGRCCF